MPNPQFDSVGYITSLVDEAEKGLIDYTEVGESIRVVLNPKQLTNTEKEKLVKLKNKLKERKTTKSIASTIEEILADIGKVVAGIDPKKQFYVIRAPETEEEEEKINTLRELFEREIYGEISNEIFYDGTEKIEWEIRGAFDEENTPVGGIWYAVINVNKQKSKYFYIEELFSHRDHRGEGLASKLVLDMLEREYELAENEEIDEVVLHSVETAVEFYTKIGFFVASEPIKKGEIELTKMVLPLTKHRLEECIDTPDDTTNFSDIYVAVSYMPGESAVKYISEVKQMLARDQNIYPFETNPLLIPLRDRVLSKKPL